MFGAVILHFFLFCNVFRIPRSLELTWAALYILVSVPVLLLGVPSWKLWLAVVAITTVIILLLAMRHRTYHGILWRVINPELISRLEE